MNMGVVIIGRNEGDRLRKCLASVAGSAHAIVYVDSGSTDDSVATACAMGIEVVELDMTIPFCAARARNAGYERLAQRNLNLKFVQFIDGDCEIIPGWLEAASMALEQRPELAIVTGWLRERFPEASIYNRLGDLEWNLAGAGELNSVGGIFMVRCTAFDGVGGFDPTIAAGEEPELCQRLIRQGWRIQRLDRDMAWHDLAMVRFGQWFKRMVRSGYGGMDVVERFGLPRFRRSNLRARLWTAWLGAMFVAGIAVAAKPDAAGVLFMLALLSLWPAQLCRIALRTWRTGQRIGLAMSYAFFMMIAFLPQMAGQLLYRLDRLRKRSFRLVEYKTPSGPDLDSSRAGRQLGATRGR